MVVHLDQRRGHRRRDVLTAPTGAGITGASTISNTVVGTGLALDTTATSISQSAIPLGFTTDPTVTYQPLNTASPDSASSADTTGSSNPTSGAGQISLGTVIGACAGALAGAIALILVGLWIYRRTAPKPRNRTPVSPHTANRNGRGEHERSRSRLEHWDKLGEGEDKWEGQYQTKEVSDGVGPMEKLTMFKKSPSVRTGFTAKSHDSALAINLEPHPFAQYHPNLAKDMATEPDPPLRPFLGRVDTGPAVSWDSGPTVTNNSLASLHSQSFDIAIPTPGITMSEDAHRWESAEVLHFDAETVQVVNHSNSDLSHTDNPFLHASERRKSINNPFFGAQSALRSSPRNSIAARSSLRDRSRSRERSTAKGKEKATSDISKDPFADENIPDIPKLKQVEAASTLPVASVSEGGDRAIQSLIAILDSVPAPVTAEVEERLRVASLQPSVYSGMSMYTEEEDVTTAFPLPPGTSK